MCRTYTVCRCIHYIPNNLRLSKMQTVQNYWQTIPALQFVGNRNKGIILTPTRERACPMRSRGTTAAEPGREANGKEKGLSCDHNETGGMSNFQWGRIKLDLVRNSSSSLWLKQWSKYQPDKLFFFPHFVFFDDEFSKTNSYRAKYGVPQSYQNKSVLQRIQFDTVAP